MATQTLSTTSLRSPLVPLSLVRLTSAILLLAVACASWALDNKPHIVVQFDINAPAFKLNLPQRSQAQKTIGSDVATQIAQRYAFVDWTLTPADNTSRLGVLLLKLEEEPNTVPNPRIVVKWFGGAEAADAKALPIPAIEVYSPTNPNWDTNSRANFETRVLDKLREAMRNDEFYAKLFNVFVRTLPIAKQAQVSPADRAIDVPINWRQMLVAPESVVRVRFRSNPGDEEGKLMLNPVIVKANPANAGGAFLRGAVTMASVGIRKITLTDSWNDQLPAILRDARVDCYLEEYKPRDFEGTLDDLVVNPSEQ